MARISNDIPHFRLFNGNNDAQIMSTIDDINHKLVDTGLSLQYQNLYGNKRYLVVNIDDAQLERVQKLVAVNNRQRAAGRAGRPRRDFPVEQVLQWQAEGLSNVEIIRRLGISKAGFYAKLKEYRELQSRSN